MFDLRFKLFFVTLDYANALYTNRKNTRLTILILYILYISSMQYAIRTKSYIAQTLTANLNSSTLCYSTGLCLDLIPIKVSSKAPSFVCISKM